MTLPSGGGGGGGGGEARVLDLCGRTIRVGRIGFRVIAADNANRFAPGVR